MFQGAGTSFDKIFDRAGCQQQPADDKPGVHMLFSMLMRSELEIPAFAQALRQYHGQMLTRAAYKLLTSVDGQSGRLSFANFQKAMQDVDSGIADVAAGAPISRVDQAEAIIRDNSGQPVAAPQFQAAKVKSDINNDTMMAQFNRVSALQASGRNNPIIPSNRVSAGNPLQRGPESPRGGGDGGARDSAQMATRMYMDGECSRKDYEEYIARLGIRMAHDSELQRMIVSHERTNDGSFAKLMQALQKELVKAESAGA
eukprot:TRINITY_DN23355_c0_g1_i1.p1 TRINITY_DN23355_c0_g1~~TRINITY_DN23355_c0_g1_i1.p1  ORF type:complete len:257 (-),score=46.97 TRINITY_DN23355_c0_g1_i1:65-835(-)